jgi:hypothetical protein
MENKNKISFCKIQNAFLDFSKKYLPVLFIGLMLQLSQAKAQDLSPLEWTAREVGPSTGINLQSVTWGGPTGQELFVAVGHNTVLTSQDGIIWTPRNAGVNNNWTSVTWGGGEGQELFVAVGLSSNGNSVITSQDGINWTALENRQLDGFLWSSVTWGGPAGQEVFVAVSRNGQGRHVMTSQDGINWTIRETPQNYWSSVTWGGPAGQKLFVAVSDLGTSEVMTSPDGITWNLQLSPRGFNWPSVTWGGPAGQELFVAVSRIGSGNRVMTSPDGITWTTQTSASDNNWSSVTWGGPAGRELFVAVAKSGSGNRVMTSPDGITWTSGDSADLSWSSVAWGGPAGQGSFVAVAEQPLNLSDIAYQAMTGVYAGPPLAVDSIAILTNTTAKVSASLGDPGDLVVSEKGLIFIDTLISQNPLLETSGIKKIVDASTATGNFEGSLSGLSPNKVYVVKAYAKTTDDQVFYSPRKYFSTNTAPSFTHELADGILSLSVAENTTAVLDVQASDPDAGQSLSFSLEGTDASLFTLNPTTRNLSFKTAPDFEDPKDQNKDNVYELTVIATDNGPAPKSSLLSIRVSVTNVAEIAFTGNSLATDIGATGAKLIGEIVHNGGGGNVTASGFVVSVTSTNATPVLNGTGVTDYPIGTTLGELSKLLTGLQENTSYSFRTYAINATGNSYAEVGTFTTLSLSQAPPVFGYAASLANEVEKAITAISPDLLGSAVPANQQVAAVSTFSTNVSGPRGMVMDAFGNLYVAETGGRRISRFAPDGTKSVIRQFDSFEPVDITIDSSTGDLYATIASHRILWIPNTNKANYTTQQPTHVWTNDATNVFAGSSTSGTTEGTGTGARFNSPAGIVISPDNTYLLVAERGSHRIRKIVIATKAVKYLCWCDDGRYSQWAADYHGKI